MFNSKKLDELAKKLTQMVPSKLRPSDMQKNFRGVLQNTLSKMDLVTREEFDVQVKVLQRTRSKLEALEQKVAELTGKTKADLDSEITEKATVTEEPVADVKEAKAVSEAAEEEKTKKAKKTEKEKPAAEDKEEKKDG